MNWKRRIGWAAVVIGILVVTLSVGGYVYLKSTAFNQFALRKIAQEADLATGGKTTIGAMDFSLSTLTADLYDITLRGTEGASQPPLLHADKLTVRIKIVSALHRQVSLRELLIEHPVAHLQVNKDGKSNLPAAPPGQSSSNTNIFDLAVGHVQLTNGEVDYNDHRIPVDADLYDLGTDIRFTQFAKRYDGTLSYRNGQVRYAGYKALPHSFDLRFSATPDGFSVAPATLNLGASVFTLEAHVSNYSNPVADANYQLKLHARDFAQMSPTVKAEGDVSLNGKLHYEASANQPLLRGVAIEGHLASTVLAAAASGKRIEMRKLEGAYTLANGDLIVSSVIVDSLGGRLSANGEMMHLDSVPESHFHASLADISLRALQQAFGAQELHGAALSGQLGGTAEASWKGGMETLHARTDLTLKARASSRSNPSTEEVPIDGAVHATYDGAHQSIELRQTVLRTPAAKLSAQGTISDHSTLQVQMVANDLHQLELLVSSFAATKSSPPSVSGRATLNATVRGSMKSPSVAAQLSAQDLQVSGSAWRSAALTVHATPSGLDVQNGSLVNARRGQASFSASVHLHNWSYQPSERIQAHLDAQQFEIADLQKLAGQSYPISGEVSAKLSVDGSQANPAGSGQIEIASANVYGEPIQKLAASFHAEDGSIVSKMTASAKAGTMNTDLSFNPATKAYKIRVDLPSIVLQQLQTLQAKNLPLTGTLTGSASGEGTLDDPQLVATLRLPELQARGQSISEMRADAKIAQHRLDLNLDSKVSQVSVHAHGQVALSGDYDADATIDTGTIPLDALMAAYAPSAPSGFQGQTELHATLKGPLKDTSHLEAHVSIPVLKASYRSLQLGITNPIRADYSNSVVTLQPADIEGTGTSLHLKGTFPLAGTASPTLTANGSIDVRILKIVAPEVDSSGTLRLDIRSSGSAANPTLQGQVQLKDVALTTPDAPVGIDKMNGTIDVANDHIHISQMTGQMGGGSVSVGGSIAYRPNLQFNLAVQSQSVRLLYPDGLRSLLDANLTFTGNTTASSLNGRVLIHSLSFTPDFDLSKFGDQFGTGGTVSQPGFADTIRLAIRVQSRENLNATSSQISIAGQAALQVGGTAADPVITGRTTLASGELFYRNVRYQLQKGVITFDDPNVTHPVLNVSVTTTVEQYNLTLNLRGPLDKLTTSYVSDPPLATADVINLVARGKTTQEQAASSQSTDSMIASQAVSQLSSSVQKLAGISSLEIDPTLGGNGQNPSARVAVQQRVTRNLLFTFSTDVSQPGSEIVQGEYQLNKRWSVSVERDQLGGVSVDGRYHSKF